MLSVHEALELVLRHTTALPASSTPLSNALGRVLAEQVISDIDSPPHDKSIVDGYAVIAAHCSNAPVELKVLEEVTAGAVPTHAVERGTATRIMTGAPLPPGADAVVMVEQTEACGAEKVRILQAPLRSGQNIMRRATSLSRGQVVLESGKLLRAMEIGLLAEVGRKTVSAIPQPRVAVLATGNELVNSSVVPGPGQIRNSNGPLLSALVRQCGAIDHDLGIARDDLSALSQSISAGLELDMLVLAGGVSAGVLDLVPQVLEKLGVAQVFHKVSLKPGKPLWFGWKKNRADRPTLVFGLPGNPVSALVSFEIFVRPALQKLRGLLPEGMARTTGRLTKEHRQRGERPTYWPAHCAGDVTPLPWQGSGDLRTLTDANCLAFFPPGERVFAAGDEIEVFWLPGGGEAP